MSPVLPPRRPFVLKASRDTLMLLVAAGAMTLAIAYSVHNRPALQSPVAEQTAVGQWAGQLADLTPQQTTSSAQAEPLSSDALTLPKAAMALPAAPKNRSYTKVTRLRSRALLTERQGGGRQRHRSVLASFFRSSQDARGKPHREAQPADTPAGSGNSALRLSRRRDRRLGQAFLDRADARELS